MVETTGITDQWVQWCSGIGGAENAGQDIAGQDNDGQEKHHAWVEIKT